MSSVPTPLTDLVPIDDLDADGALREATDAVAGDSRADFFRKGGLTAAGLLGGGLLTADIAGAKPTTKGDIKILNFALLLEYLEATFYAQAEKRNFPGITGEFVSLIVVHESDHVRFLEIALGNNKIHRPKFDFRDTTSDLAKFQETAFSLENTGVKAYSGQGPRLKSPAVLTAAARILTIEARHAAVSGMIYGQTLKGKKGITPNGSFDVPRSMSQVLKAVAKTKFIVKR